MNKTIFTLLLTAAAVPAALAQQPAPTATPNTIILQRGNMRAQPGGGAANRPDRPPVYPGGETGMGLFFLEHIKYPEAARVKQLSGTVLVNATVNVDGTVSDPKIAKSLSPECDAEALRVVTLLSGWQPAMRLKRPLPCLVQLPVPFGKAGEMRVEQVRKPGQ
jgi:protein TonB